MDIGVSVDLVRDLAGKSWLGRSDLLLVDFGRAAAEFVLD